MFTVIGIAVALFVSTNIDDLFVLLGFFADREFRASEVIAGQYLGIALLFSISVAASLLSLSIPHSYIGLLGIVVIALGVKRMIALFTKPTHANSGQADNVHEHRHGHVAAVAIVTLSNGGDNIAVYTPAFAAHSSVELAVIAAVFAVMAGIWCLVAHSAVNHPRVRTHIRRYARLVSPLVFIAIGIFVMLQAGTLELLIKLVR